MSRPEWKFYPTDEFLSLPRDPDPWLIKPLVPAAGWVSLYGQPKKARKSYLAMGMANAVGDTRVHSWLSFPVVKHGAVLYVQVDTPHDLWAKRVEDTQSGAYDLSYRNVFWASIQTMPYPFNIANHEDTLKDMVDSVAQEIGARPVFIVYDTSRKMHTMNENDSGEMTLFMAALENVAGMDTAKMIVSHEKKNPTETNGQQDEHEVEGGDLMKGNRGSGAVSGAVDTIIKMTPKGNMYYQGRAVGEEHKKLAFEHVHTDKKPCPYSSLRDCNGFVWVEDADPTKIEAKHLLQTYPNGSIRSLAGLLAKARGIKFEAARSVLSRLPEGKGRKDALKENEDET